VDGLTGLRNQRALLRELSRRAPLCSPSTPLAVLMLDFDLFDMVNQGYGRAVGDAVLKRAATVLRETSPSARLAFRYGGEEFVVLLEGDEDDACGLAEAIRTTIAAQNGALPAITVSCGVAELDAPVEPWVALDRADAALREAKRNGRNRVVVAGQAAEAESAVLVEEVEKETARRAAMALAVATLEVSDLGTAEHSDDVLTLCEALGRELELDETSLRHVAAGAQLHDVGKVAVPSVILNKPGPLTQDEWAVVREHTVIGERILRSVPEMAEVATIVRHSHEHFDGSGYPDGLEGEQIPLASRIILCADAYHAIRSDRPYRAGRPAAEALAEISDCAGTQFDPRVVGALVAVADEARGKPLAAFANLRRRRLLVLLTTLAIGTGTAGAGIPEVRDAIRSVFGASTAPTEVVPDGDGLRGIGFGPVDGPLFRLPPAATRDGKKDAGGRRHSEDPRADGTPRRQDGTGRSERQGGLDSPGGRQGGEESRFSPGPKGGPTPNGSNTDKKDPTRPQAPAAGPPQGPGSGTPTPTPTTQPPTTAPPTTPPLDLGGPGKGNGYGHIKGNGQGHGTGQGLGHIRDLPTSGGSTTDTSGAGNGKGPKPKD